MNASSPGLVENPELMLGASLAVFRQRCVLVPMDTQESEGDEDPVWNIVSVPDQTPGRQAMETALTALFDTVGGQSESMRQSQRRQMVKIADDFLEKASDALGQYLPARFMLLQGKDEVKYLLAYNYPHFRMRQPEHQSPGVQVMMGLGHGYEGMANTLSIISAKGDPVRWLRQHLARELGFALDEQDEQIRPLASND